MAMVFSTDAIKPGDTTVKAEYNDYPIEDCAERLSGMLGRGVQMRFYQKWTCAKCGERVTMSTPNKLFTAGRHEDCGHVTDIQVSGCNYLLTSEP